MLNHPSLSDIENAFQPAKEIDAPDRFAGRRDAVKACYYSLLTDGANMAIVGNRGIGKSSLARQLIHMAEGDNSLLEVLLFPVSEKLDFQTMYFTCGDAIKTSDDLLARLLTDTNCLAGWIPFISSARTELESYKPSIEARAFGVGFGLGGEKSNTSLFKAPELQCSIDTVFINSIRSLSDKKLTKNGILIVIDEFDRIADPKGFASFLKSLATNVKRVKFCLVGVAQDINDLIKEHESVIRLFTAGGIVKLLPMNESELLSIVEKAVASINNAITFDHDAARRLAVLAKGHPYMVHLVGKYALRDAFENGKTSISLADVDQALIMIAEKGIDPGLEGRYKMCVASSSQRESVLRALASNTKQDGEVYTGEAYRVALDEGVDNASQYVGQLVTEEYGAEIRKVRERYYIFSDSLFAAYVNARPRLLLQK